jgi:multidrug resistance efflux pump
MIPVINRAYLVLFVCATLLTISGCTKNEKQNAIEYRFAREQRTAKLQFRATLKPGNVSNISIDSGWGNIEWMAEEGQEVASGDLVLKIDMDNMENRLKRRERNIANQLALFEKIKISKPAEIAQLRKNLKSRELEYEKAVNEQKWLKNKKTPDQIWLLAAELEIARLKNELAQKLFALQKNVTDKGFDSPFSLRSSEIDKISKEIEFDYARRMIKQLKAPPLPEELAQVQFQKTVASGEIWLEENRMQSASISAQIQTKNLEVVLERFRSRYRSTKKSLDDSRQYAPRDGIIVHPVVWGNHKFRAGLQVWSGVTIMQVITGGNYELEALIPEAQARNLVKSASATIVLDSFPKQVLAGEIKTVGKAPKPMRGLDNNSFKFLPVEVSLLASGSFLFGSKADVTVYLQQKEGVFLPRDLLLKRKRENFVLLKTAFGVSETRVEVEDFDSDWVLWKNAPEEGVLAYP